MSSSSQLRATNVVTDAEARPATNSAVRTPMWSARRPHSGASNAWVPNPIIASDMTRPWNAGSALAINSELSTSMNVLRPTPMGMAANRAMP